MRRAATTLDAMLAVRVLGELAVEVDGAPVELPGSWRSRSVLAWLALHPGTHPRGELAARFWPELEAEHGRVVARLLAIREGDALLDGAPALRDRLSHRNRWVDPLSHLQVALLARSRAGDATVADALMATITGIAAGLRNTG